MWKIERNKTHNPANLQQETCAQEVAVQIKREKGYMKKLGALIKGDLQ